ncbi:hypothetical protein HZC32_03870, partial [Candidatus Woesearchaeota archaeon]|nr:hypothetical protein [Candidatus Woesearchaeota archaeon]
AALGIRLIFSVSSGWDIFISGIFGFGVCFALAYLFYYGHQWGGGDSKLLMGMGAVIGITYPFNGSSWNLLWFFLTLLLLGSVYGLVWISAVVAIKRTLFLERFKQNLYFYRKIHLGLGIVSLGFFILFLTGLKWGYSFIWPIIPFPLAAFYLFLFVSTAEDSCFTRKVEVKQLTEGDWLAEDVIAGERIVMKKKTLEKEDVAKLLQVRQEKKPERVLIREGIPFIPSFLLAYLVLVFGSSIFNWAWKSFLG